MDERELDALIAEKLFGWKWMSAPLDNVQDQHLCFAILVHPQDPRQDNWTLSNATCERWSDWDSASYWPDAQGMPLRGLPHYSTDIQEAWQVVVALQAQGWQGEVVAKPDSGEFRAYYYCSFIRLNRDRTGYKIFREADSEPARAICEAARGALQTTN